jgi:HSP20 family protein
MHFAEETLVAESEWTEEYEGQLAIDVYDTATQLVIKAPIAGVRQSDIEVSITDDQITIKGQRHDTTSDSVEGYLVQECYWGAFSRTYEFPYAVDSESATAKLTDGILTVSIPKSGRSKSRTLTVHAD